MIQLPPIEPEEQANQYDYQIALGGTTYRIVLTWRERTEGWYITVYNAAEELLIDGKRLAINWPALWRHRTIPEGQIVLIDTTDPIGGVECGFDDLGHRCALLFVEQDEIELGPLWWIDFTAEEII